MPRPSPRTSSRKKKPQKPARAQPPAPCPQPLAPSPWLIVHGARQNNLKNLTIPLPLERLIVVTGVSGSGKSSLVNDVLRLALERTLNEADTSPGEHDRLEGLEHLDKCIAIDQSPIGRTPRSNPATYTKVFDLIRDLFTQLPESKLRGWKPGRFSFNVPTDRGGGRCEHCEGNGAIALDMDFLADVWMPCPVCDGLRFSAETLAVRFKDKTIADVLDMEVEDALELFANQPKLSAMLKTLHEVGLDYIKLGQPAPTLSGGEAQRVKLAKELCRPETGRTLYILDEPTTGLHFEDVRKLLEMLQRLVEKKNTVLVIEHHLDVIKQADWVIDLGPEGGDAGGNIVAMGTPEEVAQVEASHTGQALKSVLGDRGQGIGKETNAQRSPTLSPTPHPPSPVSCISVRGAYQNNLQHIDVDIPRGAMTVTCGLSGSGKSTLAMDTIYTEGQRRYVESLSGYARQFLGQLPKPKVDSITGLSPAIAIEQKNTARSPRSTVGTMTEIHDYLRVIWARLGAQYCPDHPETQAVQHTVNEVVAEVQNRLKAGGTWFLAGPVAEKEQGMGDRGPSEQSGAGMLAEMERFRAAGIKRFWWEGRTWTDAELMTRLNASPFQGEVGEPGEPGEGENKRQNAETPKSQNVEIEKPSPSPLPQREGSLAVPPSSSLVFAVFDRLSGKVGDGRIAESVELAWRLCDGWMAVINAECRTRNAESETTALSDIQHYSSSLHCPICRQTFDRHTPHHFSFNASVGWCPACQGLGVQRGADASAFLTSPSLPIMEGALESWGEVDADGLFGGCLLALHRHLNVPSSRPWCDWPPDAQHKFLYGTGAEWIPGAGDRGQGLGSHGRNQKSKSSPSNPHPPTPGFSFQWKGLYPAVEALTRISWVYRHRLAHLLSDVECRVCGGGRLNRVASAVKVSGLDGVPRNLHEVCSLSLTDARWWFDSLPLTPTQSEIVGEVWEEVRSRLRFLAEVGLGYVTLARNTATLSGGEAQRVQLAAQVGRNLTGVLYVLDEPTIGLHPADNARLIAALKRLRDLGNTLIVVEHDREVIAHADHLLELGPGAGRDGGRKVAEGTPTAVSAGDSLTGRYLSGRTAVAIPAERRKCALNHPSPFQGEVGERSEPGEGETKRQHAETPKHQNLKTEEPAPYPLPEREGSLAAPSQREENRKDTLSLYGAALHNLKHLDIHIPLGRLVALTGVSGSGKSSLVEGVLWPLVSRQQAAPPAENNEQDENALAQPVAPGPFREIRGLESISKAILVDQAPIGTTPTSTPATYVGAYDEIREAFGRMPEARRHGWRPGHFSFNRAGGRCEACQGMGQRLIEMHFLPDVWVTCEHCNGRRFSAETLEVKYKGASIADVLEMRVEEAAKLFAAFPKIIRPLQMLVDVGLGYLELGQSATTLSGGEAQRVKLAAELGKSTQARPRYRLGPKGMTALGSQGFYLLDEPTTGLHFDDVAKLIAVLQRLVDKGHTVLVIEHNLDVIKCADWVLELGPEAGEKGGYLIAEGTPEQIAAGDTPTAKYLREVLKNSPRAAKQNPEPPPPPEWVRVSVEEESEDESCLRRSTKSASSVREQAKEEVRKLLQGIHKPE